jgi:type IX secretion system PorP/SprF family membrane protein
MYIRKLIIPHIMKKLLTVLLIIIAGYSFAQQDPLFSQYMFNKLAVNPGYAGSREALSADILGRLQWVGINGAPRTISASIHSPLRNQHIALGLTAYQDDLGPTIFQGGLATVAYRILFPDSRLSFGLQAGIKRGSILNQQLRDKIIPDVNFGVYYYADNYYVGISSKQLLQNKIMVVDNEDADQFTHLLRHFYGMAGMAIPMNDDVIFRPSILVKYVQHAPAQMDLNANFLFANTFAVGASYRTEKALSLMAELKITKSLRIGYAYDIWFNELKAYNTGSHELRIGFDLETLQNRMRTPRYF